MITSWFQAITNPFKRFRGSQAEGAEGLGPPIKISFDSLAHIFSYITSSDDIKSLRLVDKTFNSASQHAAYWRLIHLRNNYPNKADNLEESFFINIKEEMLSNLT
ncbi:unnamed protein product, partial [marine sediment metagenome]